MAAVLGSLAIAVVGMLAAGWAFRLDMLKRGWRRSARELPVFAERHGLRFQPASLSHDIGEVRGRWQDHEVRVLPDEGASVEVELNTDPSVRLASHAPGKAAVAEGLVEFSTGDASFDRLFATRRAPSERAPALRASPPLHAAAGRLAKLESELRYCEVSGRHVRAAFKYGMKPFVPVERLEELLPAMVDLAGALDALGGEPVKRRRGGGGPSV